MTNTGVEQKPSETALFAALRRAIANKTYKNEKFGPDDLAEIFLPAHFRFFLRFKKIRVDTRNKLDGFLPGLTEYMIARTAYFDRLFVDALNNETPQIVLLGAGYDSRSYRFSKLNRGTQIFELDIAPTQDRKKSCLKKARIAIPQNIKLAPINFNEEALGDVLVKAGYDNQKQTLFIWEGVSYYLDPESVDATLAFVSHAAHPESAIAFDYTASISEEIMRGFGVKAFAQVMKEQHPNEALMFSVADGEIGSFLAQRDLKVVEHLDNEDIERAYLTDDNGLLIGRMTAHFRFVLASNK